MSKHALKPQRLPRDPSEPRGISLRELVGHGVDPEAVARIRATFNEAWPGVAAYARAVEEVVAFDAITYRVELTGPERGPVLTLELVDGRRFVVSGAAWLQLKALVLQVTS